MAIKHFLISLKIMLMLIGFFSFKSSIAAEGTDPGPVKVKSGIYVNQIYGVSLKDNKITIDFYIWFLYKGGKINPLETFELMNGRIESKTGIIKKNINGVNYVACRVIATINKFWDVSKFPLDNHTLTVMIEDSDNSSADLIYINDVENSGINPDARVRGWTIKKFYSNELTKEYRTNYGDISLPNGNVSNYSRAIFSIDIVRDGLGQFFKLFGIMFLAAFVSFLSFFVQPTAGPRFGLGTGALFAAAANSFVVASSLPESSTMNLADKLQAITILLIFFGLANSTLSLKLASIGKEGAAKLLDKCTFMISFIIYVTAVSWIVFHGQINLS